MAYFENTIGRMQDNLSLKQLLRTFILSYRPNPAKEKEERPSWWKWSVLMIRPPRKLKVKWRHLSIVFSLVSHYISDTKREKKIGFIDRLGKTKLFTQPIIDYHVHCANGSKHGKTHNGGKCDWETCSWRQARKTDVQPTTRAEKLRAK